MVRRISEMNPKPATLDTARARSCWRPKAWRSLLQVNGRRAGKYLDSELISVSTLALAWYQLS